MASEAVWGGITRNNNYLGFLVLCTEMRNYSVVLVNKLIYKYDGNLYVMFILYIKTRLQGNLLIPWSVQN